MERKKILFEALNEYFDHIYLISLKRSTDRHPVIKNTLKGLDYSISWAVDGRDLNVNDLQKRGLYHFHLTKLLKKRVGISAGGLSMGHLGCALSHVNVYKDILKKDYKNALIFEDDIEIELDAVDSTIRALQELPEDWELLRLGFFGANSDPSLLLKIQKWSLQTVMLFFQRFERLKLLDPQVIGCWFDRPFSKNLNYSGYHFGNHAYAVTQKGAQKILNYQTPVVQRSDDVISELCTYRWINAFNVKERVFYQDKSIQSTIA